MPSDWASYQTAKRGFCRKDSGRIALRRLPDTDERYVGICDDCGYSVGPVNLRSANLALNAHYKVTRPL